MSAISTSMEGLPERRFEPGEVIIAEGQAAEGLFYLCSGTVAASKEGVEIQKINVPGAIFGEMSYLLECEPTATVKAVTPCVLKLVSDRGNFIRQHPETALYIARILAARLDSVVRYLVDLKAQLLIGDSFSRRRQGRTDRKFLFTAASGEGVKGEG